MALYYRCFGVTHRKKVKDITLEFLMVSDENYNFMPGRYTHVSGGMIQTDNGAYSKLRNVIVFSECDIYDCNVYMNTAKYILNTSELCDVYIDFKGVMSNTNLGEKYMKTHAFEVDVMPCPILIGERYTTSYIFKSDFIYSRSIYNPQNPGKRYTYSTPYAIEDVEVVRTNSAELVRQLKCCKFDNLETVNIVAGNQIFVRYHDYMEKTLQFNHEMKEMKNRVMRHGNLLEKLGIYLVDIEILLEELDNYQKECDNNGELARMTPIVELIEKNRFGEIKQIISSRNF